MTLMNNLIVPMDGQRQLIHSQELSVVLGHVAQHQIVVADLLKVHLFNLVVLLQDVRVYGRFIERHFGRFFDHFHCIKDALRNLKLY